MQISPTHLRGTLGSINQLLICVGILAALVVNVVLPATSWRSMFWLAAAPAALLGLGERGLLACCYCLPKPFPAPSHLTWLCCPH